VVQGPGQPSKRVQFTPEEEAQRDVEEAEYARKKEIERLKPKPEPLPTIEQLDARLKALETK
jgi:hypothetical protein